MKHQREPLDDKFKYLMKSQHTPGQEGGGNVISPPGQTGRIGALCFVIFNLFPPLTRGPCYPFTRLLSRLHRNCFRVFSVIHVKFTPLCV